MPDFTSALYLGLGHPARALRPWVQLTTGTPAAIRQLPGAVAVARRLARLQGCETATLVPSTLHAAWDLGALVTARRETIHVERGAYPILVGGATRAAARGVAVRGFAHHDPASLARSLRADRRRPIVLVDGLDPASGRPAPLAEYLRAARRHGGLLVVDDTQALGILGGAGGSVPAWGRGGGGSLRFHDLVGAPDVLLVSSAAKALGVPVAAVSGAADAVADYASRGETRVHASPVAAPAIAALEHALGENRARGELLRLRVARVIARFRDGLRAAGIECSGALFPVQALPCLHRDVVTRLHRRLRAADIHTVPQACTDGGRIVFVLTARTREADVDAALDALARAPELAPVRLRRRPGMHRSAA